MVIYNWEDPVKFSSRKLPGFPVEVLPSIIKNYVEGIAKELKVNVDMPSVAVLGLLSKILTRSYKFYLKETDWTLDLNLYTLITVGSGANKTAVNNKVFFPLENHEMKNREREKNVKVELRNALEVKEKQSEYLANLLKKKDDEELIERREEALTEIEDLKGKLANQVEYLTGNTTMENLFNVLENNNEITAIITDEISDLINILSGKYNGKIDIDLLLKAYDGSRVDTGREKNDKLKILNNPLLIIMGFTQPSVLQEFRRFSGRGLAERFLYSMPVNEFQKGLGIKISENNKKSYERLLNDMLKNSESNTNAVKISLGKDTLNDFETLFELAEKEKYNDDNPDILQGWYAKLIGKIMKIVVLLHVTQEFIDKEKVEALILNRKDMDKARKLFDYFEEHAKKAFGVVNDNILEQDPTYLVKKIAALQEKSGRDFITKTELQQNTKRKFNKNQRETLIAYLKDMNLLKILKDRSKTKIYLNPYYKKAFE